MKDHRRALSWMVKITSLALLVMLLSGTTAADNPPGLAEGTIVPGGQRQHPREHLFNISRASTPVVVTYFDMNPLVVSTTVPENVELQFHVSGSPSLVQIVLNNGSTLTLTDSGGGLYTVTLSHAQVLYGYKTNQCQNNYNHNHFGYLEVYEDATPLCRRWLIINVVDDQIPAVSVQSLAADVQKSPHVANILMPDMDPASPDLTAATKRFYELFPDDYDFINVILAPQRFANRYHSLVKNTVQGIGLGIFDNSANFGSAGRLIGINVYPLAPLFDLAVTSAVHEIGHQWINHLTSPSMLDVCGSHWPISSLAQSPMGYSDPINCQGLSFPWELTPLGDGNYLVTFAGYYRTFSDMDLYLMGMLPPEDVGAHFVFDNQDQTPTGGGILYGPVTTVTVDDVILANGPRVPSYPNAQTKFRVATIIVSESRLLTPTEMAFFDYFAYRGSLTTPLPYSEGLGCGITYPFHLATRRVGCLVTTLDYDGGCYSVFLPMIVRSSD